MFISNLRSAFRWASLRKDSKKKDAPVIQGVNTTVTPPNKNPKKKLKEDLKSDTSLQTPRKSTRQAFKAAWKLIKPYWKSKDKWKGLALLGAVVALTLGQVYMAVEINSWNNDFYNALQNKDLPEFWKQLGKFTGLAGGWIGMAVYTQYLMQALQLRWRKWMTSEFSKKWLDKKAFYRLQTLYGSTDNPDQRISEDINGFTSSTLNLGIGLLNSAVMLGSFVGILWGLSGDSGAFGP